MPAAHELLAEGRRRLAGLPGSDPALEARVLLRRASGFTEMELLAFPGRPVPMSGARRYRRSIARRAARVPFAYILGEREFWSIPLAVGPGVLIPRPETELLVETVLDLAEDGEETIAEIGTGSGAVAVALAKEMPGVRIIATDISGRALGWARKNASRQGAGNIEFRAGDLFAPLRRPPIPGGFDLLVSNPPYVAEAEWRRLEPEVRDFEPKPALVAGPTGLEIIARLVAGAPEFLKPGGRLVFEIGRGQAGAVRALLRRPWMDVLFKKDLRGIPRTVVARLGV
ncbi:MAG: peptide chain release factor N(5)-glutamine methyltransferase [Candidatus Aminicenantales bacterium]|jgi:release factor glutamine methyltransferase